jgi:uncharacterized protein YndB with AHSA1/START domain
MRYVTGEVLRVEPPKLLEYKFGMGDGAVMSKIKVELTPETEAVKVVVTNDEWQEGDPACAQNADGASGQQMARKTQRWSLSSVKPRNWPKRWVN